MPRFNLNQQQQKLLLEAIVRYARDRERTQNKPLLESVARLIVFTAAELNAELGPFINQIKAENTSKIASTDAEAAAQKTVLADENVQADNLLNIIS